jgi:hypothetical protein
MNRDDSVDKVGSHGVDHPSSISIRSGIFLLCCQAIFLSNIYQGLFVVNKVAEE